MLLTRYATNIVQYRMLRRHQDMLDVFKHCLAGTPTVKSYSVIVCIEAENIEYCVSKYRASRVHVV